MKIICLQENLKTILNIAERIIGRNLTLPILNNILLSTEKNKIKVSSTNLEIGINCWAPCKVEKEGNITVSAKLINDFINNLPNKKIELNLKNSQLNIKCENFTANLNGISADDFPIIPKIKGNPLVKIKGNYFKNGLSQVVEMASISESRPEISGILMEFNKKTTKLVATDGFRLAEKNIEVDFLLSEQKGQSIIIPQRTAQELIRILSEKESDIEIILSGNQILFDLGHTQLISRLIEGQYPDYKQIIPSNFGTQVIIDRYELMKNIKVASLFSSKINDIKVGINPEKKILEISSKNANVGENKSRIESKIEGKKLEINFNYRYVLDGLNNILSDKVVINFNNSANPAVIQPVGDTSYTYVVMPIKI